MLHEVEIQPRLTFAASIVASHCSRNCPTLSPPNAGRLTSTGWTPSDGKTPRFFALDPAGRHVFVANEDCDTIVRFIRGEASGPLGEGTTVAKTGSPTRIVFA